MTTSMRMEENQSHMTERMLNLNLEIIYLLTGESYPLVKSGDQVTIMVPPPHSLKPERNNTKKILEVTQKMIGVLTGEVPIRCQDVTVYFSMEEWEYLEGHKDLYKDVMMDNQPPLTSPDHMTTSMRMEADQSHMTKRILNLTLEIIYLLTGESYPLVKSGDQVTIMVPPPHSLKPERNNTKKILEVIQKMIGVLTGEVPIRCQDVTVYFSMEEWEYLEGHKDLYKDVMMDNQPPLTSPDGSSNRNPPERCPHPLYSRDSTQEDLTIPLHHQNPYSATRCPPNS
ncbi:uncharacterized protein ACMZJ9_020658 [Mantella aurantiaca]